MKYEFGLIFIDNHSQDGIEANQKKLAESAPMVKLIVTNRNFGNIRSPYYGILQSRGVATICFASDLQNPPKLNYSSSLFATVKRVTFFS